MKTALTKVTHPLRIIQSNINAVLLNKTLNRKKGHTACVWWRRSQPASVWLCLPQSGDVCRISNPGLKPKAPSGTHSIDSHCLNWNTVIKQMRHNAFSLTPTLEGLFLTHFPFARDPHRAPAAAAFTPGEHADCSPNLAPKSSHETSRLCYYFHVAHPSIVFGNKIHPSIYSILF